MALHKPRKKQPPRIKTMLIGFAVPVVVVGGLYSHTAHLISMVFDSG